MNGRHIFMVVIFCLLELVSCIKSLFCHPHRVHIVKDNVTNAMYIETQKHNWWDDRDQASPLSDLSSPSKQLTCSLSSLMRSRWEQLWYHDDIELWWWYQSFSGKINICKWHVTWSRIRIYREFSFYFSLIWENFHQNHSHEGYLSNVLTTRSVKST